MRFALLPALMLALPLLSGCAGLVEEDPSLDGVLPSQAAALLGNATQAVEALPGHIAGKVVDAALAPIAGAAVHLQALNLTHLTDADGSFAFVDLQQGDYALEAVADGFLDGSLLVEVLPGAFARPQLALQPVPAPEPYSEVIRFDGYSDLLLGPFGYAMQCDCWFDLQLADGLQEIVLEAVLSEDGGPMSANDFSWWMSFYDNATDEGSSFDGWGGSPLAVRLTGEEIGPATEAGIQVMPEGGLVPEANRAFSVYVTTFYHAPAPEGYTALPVA